MSTKFDNLETLRKAAWESIATRREFEWRVNLAFWTLIAAFIAGVATTRVQEIQSWAKYLFTGIPLGLGAAHLIWLAGLARGYGLDKNEESAFREAMHVEMNYIEPTTVALRRQSVTRPDNMVSWNFISQAMTTAVLTAAAIFSLWLIRPAENVSKAPDATHRSQP